MSGLHNALRLHVYILKLFKHVFELESPEEKLTCLAEQKACIVHVMQTRRQDGILQDSTLQDLAELIKVMTKEEESITNLYIRKVLVCWNNIRPASSANFSSLAHNRQTANITQDQEATIENSENHSRKRATGAEWPEPSKKHAKKLVDLGSEKRVSSLQPTCDGTDLEGTLAKLDIQIPRPGALYQVLCRSGQYIPATVLFPDSEGPFSAKDANLVVNASCRYNEYTNTLSFENNPTIYYPIQYFDKEEPTERQAMWIEAGRLEPFNPAVTIPYNRWVSEYIMKYGQS